MADNAKETGQTTPAKEPADDNRRRTRSQTRNGGVTPTAPVVEPRGRKRTLPTPGGAKRGRKSTQKPPAFSEPSESYEHSKLTQDLSKQADTKGNKDESVEMKVEEEKEQKSNNEEIQESSKKDDVCTPKKKQEPDDSTKEDNLTESIQAEGKTESTEQGACSLPKKDEDPAQLAEKSPASSAKATVEKKEEVHESNDQKSCELKKDETEEEKEKEEGEAEVESEAEEVEHKNEAEEVDKSLQEAQTDSKPKKTDEDTCTIKKAEDAQPVETDDKELEQESAICVKTGEIQESKPGQINNDVGLGGEVVKND